MVGDELSTEAVAADDARYAALAKEIGVDLSAPDDEAARPPADKPAEPAKSEPEKAEAPKPIDLAEFEKVRSNYENVQKALSESRAELKSRRDREDKLTEQLNSVQEFIRQQLVPRQQAQQTPEEQARAYLASLEHKTQATADQLAQLQAQEAARTAQNELMNWAVAAEREVLAQKPDYMDAAKHLETARGRQIKAMWPAATDADIKAQIQTDQRAMIEYARKNGANPAAAVYEMAQIFGYQPRGTQRPTASATPPKGTVDALATIKAGRESSSSLGSTSSADVEQFPSVEALADLYANDPEKGAAMYAKMKAAGVFDE